MMTPFYIAASLNLSDSDINYKNTSKLISVSVIFYSSSSLIWMDWINGKK